VSRIILHPDEVSYFASVRARENSRAEQVELLSAYVRAGADVEYLADTLNMRSQAVRSLLSLSPRYTFPDVRSRYGKLCAARLHQLTPTTAYVRTDGRVECVPCRNTRQRAWLRASY
jgi:hypothetical protein